MKLLSLKLNNFRQHADSFIEFKDGLSALIGPNGCGKSTLLEAITFSLFGEQRSAKDSIRFAWATSKKFSVTLRFECDGSILEVMRSNDSASFADITGATPKVLASSLAQVTGVVETRLGMTYEQFVNSFFAEQKSLAFLNFKSNADRQKEVAKMLGFDRLQKAEDIARDKAKNARLRVEALASVMGDVTTLKADVATKEAELSEISGELIAATDKLGILEAIRPTVEAKAEQAKQYGELSNQIQALSGRYGALKESRDAAGMEFTAANAQVERRAEIKKDAESYLPIAEELKAIAAAKSQVGKRAQIAAEIDTKQSEIKTLDAQIKAIKGANVAALTDEMQAKQAAHEQFKASFKTLCDDWTEKKTTATTTLAVAQSRLQNATKALNEAKAKADQGLCPQCGQEISESSKPNISEFEQAVTEAKQAVTGAEAEAQKPEPLPFAQMRSAIEERQAEIKSLEIDINAARQSETERTRIQTQIDLREQSIKGLESQLSELPSAYDVSREHTLTVQSQMLEKVYDEYLSLAGAADRFARAEAAQKLAVENINAAKTQNDDLRAKRALLGFETPDAAVHAIDELITLNTDASTLAAEIKGLNQREHQAETAVADAKKRVEEYKTREAEIKAATAEKVLNETLTNEMKALRLQLNASIAPELGARASEILSLLTNGRYTVLELNDKFEASLIDDGITKSVLSGGEEDVRDIALRIGLAELIQERTGRAMSLLILDEIFGSLDGERRQSVLDALIGLKSRFSQIILISHIEGTSEVADNIIYLRRDPITKATVVGDGPDELEVAA